MAGFDSLVLQEQRHLKWRALDPLENLLMILCGVCITAFSVLVLGDVITRAIGRPWLWVHPRVVTPSNQPGGAPSDAIVLFNGSDLSQWRAAKTGPNGGIYPTADLAPWKVESGILEAPRGRVILPRRRRSGTF